MKVSVQIATRDRFKPLCRAVLSALSQDYDDFEIVVLDDASETLDVCSQLREEFEDPRIRCFSNEAWSGVAAVRARMMELSDADIYCSIDDDGAFAHDSCLTQVVEAFRSDPKIGLLTGKIKDYRDNKERLLLPFGQRALKANSELVNSRHRVSYFRAGFYAVRREVIEKCGSYRPEMRYGEEELDLSYRIIAAGYDIIYEPKTGAYHWPEPSAFRTDHPRHEIYYQIKNRLYLAYAYLPTIYIPSYISIWLARYLGASLRRGHMSDYFAGVRDGVVEMRCASRMRLDDRAVDYLRNNYGRLWY